MNLPHHDISMYDDSFVAKTCAVRIAETKCGSLQAYIDLVHRDSAEEDALMALLHINYSEFFRSSLTFATLEKIVFPAIIHKAAASGQREVRVWSCGCAGGQEPYSIAIVLDELLNTPGQDIEYRIFATDACEKQILLAKNGLFTNDSLGPMCLRRLDKYFVKNEAGYCVDSVIKRAIDFSVFDLYANTLSSPPASIFGGFDVVLCCNLLFYYKPEVQKVILDKLRNSLGREGYLVTGEAERGIVMENGFEEVFLQSGVFRG